MSQAGMRTRLKQLRALLNLTNDNFYEYSSESGELCPLVWYYKLRTFLVQIFRGINFTLNNFQTNIPVPY